MLNVDYGATLQLFFNFFDSLDFLPELNSNNWVKNEELYKEYFFELKGEVSGKMEGGFLLTTNPLNCIFFFVKNFS